jgi:2-C-methyl-D-erythritol 4-phosphate cytidylyltransferase
MMAAAAFATLAPGPLDVRISPLAQEGFRQSNSPTPIQGTEPSRISSPVASAITVGTAAALCRQKRQKQLLRHRGSVASAQSFVTLRANASDVGVVLLSGGVGKRMGAKIPKQYLKLLGLEIVLHSLDTFLECDIAEIVIVCAPEYHSLFLDHVAKRKDQVGFPLKFAEGGKERQDSVQNGLAKITSEFVAIHDGARPLVTRQEVEKVMADARKYGAALLAVQTKATVKQAVAGPDNEAIVQSTPNRKFLWEAHTPQVIRSELLRRGFSNAAEKSLEVTDDVSLVEQLGEPVKITEGEYTNIKVTTPEDMAVAEAILKERGYAAH